MLSSVGSERAVVAAVIHTAILHSATHTTVLTGHADTLPVSSYSALVTNDVAPRRRYAAQPRHATVWCVLGDARTWRATLLSPVSQRLSANPALLHSPPQSTSGSCLCYASHGFCVCVQNTTKEAAVKGCGE